MRLRQKYIIFIESDKDAPWKIALDFFLQLLSLIYGLIVSVRNFLYDKSILPAKKCSKPVICVGNLSWGGTGKTSLSLFLWDELSKKFNTAILRRGYGIDEEKILKEKNQNTFSGKNRAKLAMSLAEKFDLFILDDGFGHRQLRRDLDIVIMGAREFECKYRLIPASYFRERLDSLKRADIVILSYKSELISPHNTKEKLQKRFPHLKIFFADYKVVGIIDLKNQMVDKKILDNRKVAALTAIGYPKGFFNKLNETGIKVAKKITYPDHYQFSKNEFLTLQDKLIKEGISNLIISAKDRYHFPENEIKLNIFILQVELALDNAATFIESVNKYVQNS
ncbi:MAG: tetraacyldisaccharide 4'-kinase [Candidatus Omnitrophica bacterium]|nr:tetraacyldisaccharide 4'-kinase [Candidatus Omnitrophota bacterium]